MDIKKIFDLNYNYKTRNNWLFTNDRYRFVKTIRGLIFSKILNKYSNFNPLVLTDKTKYGKKHIYSRSQIKIVSLRETTFLNSLKLYLEVIKNLILFYLKIITKKNKFSWFINNFKLYDVHIGDLIYDFYIRYNHEYLNPNIFSLKFFKILAGSFYKINFINMCCLIYKPKIIITTSRGYTSIGNLLLRYGVKKKILTIFTAYNFNYMYKSYSEVFGSVYRVTKDKIDYCEKNISKKKIENFAKQRLVGKKHGSYTNNKTLKKVYNKHVDTKFLSILKKAKNSKKKIIVFALHCFSDTPHASGRMIFNDYFDQFISTIEFIKNIGDSNLFWVVKPHPGRGNYGENGIIEKYLKNINLENLVLCSEKFGNQRLFKFTDYLITTRSTIAVEFACHGKKSILGGDAPYYLKSLFLKPANKEKYFNIIKNIENIDLSLNSKEISLAKKLLYILEFKTNVALPDSKFLPNPIKYPEINTEKNYTKILKKNFKKIPKQLTNQNFMKEIFYKKIKEELINFAKKN